MPITAYTQSITNPAIKEKLEEVLAYLAEKHPDFLGEIKWKKPMFSKDGTFIIGFDAAKKHLSVIPEPYAIEIFKDDIKAAGLSSTENLFKFAEDQDINFPLLEKIIAFKLEDKKGEGKYFK